MKNELKSSPIGLLPNDWRIGMLGEYLDYIQPTKYITKSFNEIGNTPVLTANKAFILGYTDETEGVYNNVPVIIFDDFTTDSKFVDFPFKVRSSALKILAFTTKEIDINYLYESLKRIKYQSTEHKRYWISEYQYLKIPIPPLPEQQKIAEILSTVDAKIEIIDQQISETQELKKGLMQQLLTKGIGHAEFKDSALGKIPKSWEVVTVKEITKEHKQGFYTKDGYVEDGVRLVRITDLNNPKVDYTNMPKLKISDSDFQSYKIEENDFLFARSGAIGRYGIVEKEEFPAVFASYLIRFRFNSDIINRFFGYFFESHICSIQLRSITQGNANVNINAENIKSLKFPFAPFSEQKQIAEILTSFDDKLEVLLEKKITYQEMKQGLMQQLLTGKVRV
jgi:type I restriction enzyme S subunit